MSGAEVPSSNPSSEPSAAAGASPETPGGTLDSLTFPPAEDWQTYFTQLAMQLLIYAAQNPWSFLYTVFLCLSPLFFLSAICAYKLAKDIENRDKEKKKKAKRDANIARTRRHKDD